MNSTTGNDAPSMPNPFDVAAGSLPPRAHAIDYLIVLARHRWRIGLFVVIGTLLVAIYTLVQPQTFSATAVLLPPEKNEGISFSDLIGKSAGFDLGGLGENSAAELFISMLRSRTLSDSVIDRLQLLKRYELGPGDRQLAMEMLQSSLDVKADRQGVITISSYVETGWLSSDREQSETAAFSAALVNEARRVLDQINREKAVSSARRSREFIGRMLVVKRAELDSVQRALLSFQQRNKAIALDKQVEASVAALAELQIQIQKKDLELQASLNELDPSTPQVGSLQAQLSRLRQQKNVLESGRAGSTPFAIDMAAVPELMREYANLMLDLEVSTQVFTFLEAQYHKEQVQEARDLPTVQVLDDAVAPQKRVSPRRGLALSIAAPTLLIIAVLAAFIVEGAKRGHGPGGEERAEELRTILRRRRRVAALTDGPTDGR